MSVMNLNCNRQAGKRTQRGNFTVEFAIVGVFFALLLAFSGDVIIKLSHNGKLDRLSFSLVNMLKERTQFFSEGQDIQLQDVDDLYLIAENSLRRTLGTYEAERFGVVIESLSFRGIGEANSPRSFQFGAYQCQLSLNMTDLEELSVVTSWGRQAPLYRVTLCYQTDNWFGRLVDGDYTRVQSSSVIIGR
ncbi:tight adherence pilus pseudopilin TadF [Vibrio paucivorans]